MKVAVDLDATITAYPEFFRFFCSAMMGVGCEVHIVTDREAGTEDAVRGLLAEHGIAYDRIMITRDKVGYICGEGIEALFDDTDEYFLDLPEEVAVFKVRGHYNFDFLEHKWLS